MIQIPDYNENGLPIKRVWLHHSGGVGSTMVLYQLMKDIIDRGLDVTLNVATLHRPLPGVFKDRYFALSTAKKCQDLLGFDSEKLIIQDIDFADAVNNPLQIAYFDHKTNTKKYSNLSIVTDSDGFGDEPIIYYRIREVNDTPEQSSVTVPRATEIRSRLNYNPLQNIFWFPSIELYNLADSDGERQEIFDNYIETSGIRTINRLAVTEGYADIWYSGNYRNPPEEIQNAYVYEQGVTGYELTHGYDASVDSDDQVTDPLHFVDSEGGIHNWWQKDPLMGIGDARDLYTLFYSLDSDRESLFWHTRSCSNQLAKNFNYDELLTDSDLYSIWDSETVLYNAFEEKFWYQLTNKPLHRYLPHCSKCWKCQTRGYGFEDWIQTDNDWLRTESSLNPPATPSPKDALIQYDLRRGGSLPGVNPSDILNLGTIGGIGQLVSEPVYDSENYYLLTNGTNQGIISQSIRQYLDSEGTVSYSYWFKTNGIDGTILADLNQFTSSDAYCGLMEIYDGNQLRVGFVGPNQTGDYVTVEVLPNAITNITVTYNGVTGDLKVYKNGVLAASDTGMFRSIPAHGSTLFMEVGFGNHNLNYNFTGVSYGSYQNDLIGEIHRFALYPRELSPTEVAGLYQAEKFMVGDYTVQ